MKQTMDILEGNEALQAEVTKQAMQFAEVTLMIARKNRLSREQVVKDLETKKRSR